MLAESHLSQYEKTAIPFNVDLRFLAHLDFECLLFSAESYGRIQSIEL